MLSVEDREFLLKALAVPVLPAQRVSHRDAIARADQAMLDELESIGRLGSPSERALALRVAALPVPQGEQLRCVNRACQLLASEMLVITSALPKPNMASCGQNPIPPADRFE